MWTSRSIFRGYVYRGYAFEIGGLNMLDLDLDFCVEFDYTEFAVDMHQVSRNNWRL